MQPKISLFLEYERKSVDPKRTPLHKSWALLSVYFQVWDRLIFACAIGNKWQTDTRSCLLAQAFSQCMEHWDWLFHNPQTAVRQVATVDRTSVQLAALWSRGRVSLPGGGEGRQGLHPRHMAFPPPPPPQALAGRVLQWLQSTKLTLHIMAIHQDQVNPGEWRQKEVIKEVKYPKLSMVSTGLG